MIYSVIDFYHILAVFQNLCDRYFLCRSRRTAESGLWSVSGIVFAQRVRYEYERCSPGAGRDLQKLLPAVRSSRSIIVDQKN